MGMVQRILVRQGGGTVFGNGQHKIAALRDVQELHTGTDAENRQTAVGDLTHQAAVERFATGIL